MDFLGKVCYTEFSPRGETHPSQITIKEGKPWNLSFSIFPYV